MPDKRGLGVAASDFNNEGYRDIYVSNDAESNPLWINLKDSAFSDIATQFGTAVNRFGARDAGMGIALGDANNNLSNDIYVAHLTGESSTPYLNHSQIGFEDASQTAIWKIWK